MSIKAPDLYHDYKAIDLTGRTEPKKSPRHEEIINTALEASLDRSSLDEIYTLFAYLKNYVIAKSQYDDAFIVRNPHWAKHDKHYHGIRTADENLFSQEIEAMKNLQKFMRFSDRFIELFEEIFNAFQARLLPDEDFIEAMKQGNSLSAQEKRAHGCGILYCFTKSAEDITNLNFTPPPLHSTTEYDAFLGDLCSFTPGYSPLSEDSPYLIWNPNPDENMMDIVKFSGLIVHEIIHNLIWQKGKKYTEGEYNKPSLKQDMQHILFRAEFRTAGNLMRIPELYFGDMEEDLCYGTQFRFEDKLEKLLQAQAQTITPPAQP